MCKDEACLLIINWIGSALFACDFGHNEYSLFCFLFQKIPDVALSEEMIADSLSLLCKTGDGLAHAYVRLDVHEK